MAKPAWSQARQGRHALRPLTVLITSPRRPKATLARRAPRDPVVPSGHCSISAPGDGNPRQMTLDPKKTHEVDIPME